MAQPRTPVLDTAITKIGEQTGGNMERVLFGKLVQVLRKEHRDDEDNVWTQEILGKKANLSKRTIERIEEGSLKKLDADTLLHLADALELTTGERREFFFAAVGIDYTKLASPGADHSAVLNKLIEVSQSVNMPAFIHDPFGDIIAANTTIIQLLEVSEQMIVDAEKIPAGFNIMRFVFDPELGFRGLIDKQWYNSARSNIQFFRVISLRYRTHPYFSCILSALRKYSLFRQYWQSAHLEEEDIVISSEYYEYNHPRYGNIHYLANVSTDTTNKGELYLVIYIPMSENTSEVFKSLSKNRTGVRLLTPWPDKFF